MIEQPEATTELLAVAAQPIDVHTGETVCDVIAEALGRPRAQVQLTSNLFDDLGADSLDLLDLVFALEGKFDIEITRGALEQAARGDMTAEEFAPGGSISAAGLERLRALLPESRERIKPGLLPREIPTLFTVGTFARIVIAKRAGTR
ncbi:MAG: putative acyl carrier protein [Myxococcales bacterium]|nr:putative acyl carrier protein [Myxococcales bacterium]